MHHQMPEMQSKITPLSAPVDEAMLDVIDTGLSDGCWAWDRSREDQIWVGRNMWALLGLERASGLAQLSRFLEHLHSSHRGAMLDVIVERARLAALSAAQGWKYINTQGNALALHVRFLELGNGQGGVRQIIAAHTAPGSLAPANDSLWPSLTQRTQVPAQAVGFSEAQSAFSSKFNHDVRTPLNTVTGLFELIARTAADPKQVKRARHGLLAASQMLDLINARQLENDDSSDT